MSGASRRSGAHRRAAVAACLEGRSSALDVLASLREASARRATSAPPGRTLEREVELVEAREIVAALLALAGAGLRARSEGLPDLARVLWARRRLAPCAADGGRLRATRALAAAGDRSGVDEELAALAESLDRGPLLGPAPDALAARALALAERRGLPTARARAVHALACLALAIRQRSAASTPRALLEAVCEAPSGDGGLGYAAATRDAHAGRSREHDAQSAAALAAAAQGSARLLDDAPSAARRSQALRALALAHELAGRPRLALAALCADPAGLAPHRAEALALAAALGELELARAATALLERAPPGERRLGELVRARAARWRLAPGGAELLARARRTASTLRLAASSPAGAIARARA